MVTIVNSERQRAITFVSAKKSTNLWNSFCKFNVAILTETHDDMTEVTLSF